MNCNESLGQRVLQISGNETSLPLPNSQFSAYASTEIVTRSFAKTQASVQSSTLYLNVCQVYLAPVFSV